MLSCVIHTAIWQIDSSPKRAVNLLNSTNHSTHIMVNYGIRFAFGVRVNVAKMQQKMMESEMLIEDVERQESIVAIISFTPPKQHPNAGCSSQFAIKSSRDMNMAIMKTRLIRNNIASYSRLLLITHNWAPPGCIILRYKYLHVSLFLTFHMLGVTAFTTTYKTNYFWYRHNLMPQKRLMYWKVSSIIIGSWNIHRNIQLLCTLLTLCGI